jgi:hypothetical protein
MSATVVSINRPWRAYGTSVVSITNDLPVFPTEPKPLNMTQVPGLYRLTFNNGYVYIGKAGHLPARLGNYRSPTQGTEQEHVLKLVLLNAGGATLEVITAQELVDGRVRHKWETEEIQAAIEQGLNLLNKGGRGYRHYLEFKVKYYETMLAHARAELAGTV